MKLEVLRFFERLFLNIGYFFEDWADSIDTDLHNVLQSAIKEVQYPLDSSNYGPKNKLP